jgi:phosphoglycolate phosphatase
MPHDLLLFDLDGTLSDPLEGIGRSINYALTHLGFPEQTMADLAAFIGPPLDESFGVITGIRDVSVIRALVARYRERYAEVGYSENILYPGMAEVLEDLGRAGMPMAVCTSKRVDFAEQILEMFGLRHHFQFVSGGEIGTHKWQQMAALCSQNRVTPSSVMIGDRAVDMVAAHRNGLSAVAVLWGYGSPAELDAESPRYCFSAPGDLLQLRGYQRDCETM